MKGSRRTFIKSASIIGGGLGLGMMLPSALEGKENESDAILFEPNLVMQLGDDGILHYRYTRHEMGQGTFTGLTMIIVEELGADWEKVKAIQADYNVKYGNELYGGTGGSFTVKNMWQPLRELAAAARMMLTRTAAYQWNVNEADCYSENSFIIHRPSGRKVGFGELAEEASLQSVPTELIFKSPEDYTIIGTHKRNLNTDKIVDGALDYSYDTKVPKMVYAAIARSPYYHGQMKGYNAEKALKIKGVIDVVTITKKEAPLVNDKSMMREGVAIIAESTWAAFEAKKQLEIEWESDLVGTNMETLAAEFERAADKEPDAVNYSAGDVSAQMEKAEQVFSRSYTNPFQVHALMEPMSATADFRGDSCEIWSSTQHPFRTLEITGEVVGLSVDQFIFHNLPCGGSFGRRFFDDFITEAVFLSKKISRPVKVVWSREDEISTSGYHAYHIESHTVGLDDEQNIIAWNQQTVMSAQEDRYQYSGYPVHHYFNTHRHQVVKGVRAYLLVMPWRSVAVHQNALGVESFIDELAHELGKDPLQYRLDLVNNREIPQEFPDPRFKRTYDRMQNDYFPRPKRVYEKMMSLPAWTSPLLPGRARGVAGHSFYCTTFAGHIVELSVVRGKLNIHKITCVVDCGRVINPHLAQGQIEGSIIWGLSALLNEKITLKDGRVEQSNYHDYPVLRIDKCPEIEVIFIESDEAPSGVGEPAVPPLAPAVLNAIFAATGKRLRELPIGEMI